jgi:hypothetical protein
VTSRRQARRALEIHGDELCEFPNVVGVGMGRAGHDGLPAAERDHTVAVYVTEKKPARELGPDGLLPGFVEIPGRPVTRQVAIQVIEIGAPELQSAENRNDEPPGASTFSAE